ncbi:serine/arginine repetitive matrix protein 2-like [Haliotis cracherodii]|uniref:serine/arginine repetitive matrix protein 2-like n=1 Tax=Haliotis cracherodii TaxID=6455 RepID=UPI0039E8A50A
MSSTIPPCSLSPQRDRAPDDSDMDLVSSSHGSPVIQVVRQNHTRRHSGSTIFTSSELTSDSCTTAPGKFTDSWSDSTDDLRGENICGRGRRKRSYSESNCHAGRPRRRSRSMSCSRSPSRRRSCSRSNFHVRRRRSRSMSCSRSPSRRRSCSRSNFHVRRRRRGSMLDNRSPIRQIPFSRSNSHTRRSRSTSDHRSPPRRRSNSGSNSRARQNRSISGHRSPSKRRSYSGSNSHERQSRSTSGHRYHPGRRSNSGSYSYERRRSRSISGLRSPPRRRSNSGSYSYERRSRSTSGHRSPPKRRSYSGSNSHERQSRSTSGHRYHPGRRSNSGSYSYERRRSRSISGLRSPPRRRSNSGSYSYERRSRTASGHRSPPRRRSYSGSNTHERRRRSTSGHRSHPSRRSYSGSNSHERQSRPTSGHRSPPRRRSYSGSNSHERQSRSTSGHRSPPRRRSYSGSNSHERQRSRSISGHRSPPRRRSYSGSNSHERQRSRSISGNRSHQRQRSVSESPSSGGTKVTAQHIYVRRWSRKRSGSGSKSSSPDFLDVSGPTSLKKIKVSDSPTSGSDMTKTLNVKQILDEGKLSEMKRRKRASADLQELNLTSSFEPSAGNISQPQTVGISPRTSQEKDQRDNTHVSERGCQLPSSPYATSNLDIVSLVSYDSELPTRVSPVMKTTDMPRAPTLFSSNYMSVSLSGEHTAGHGQTGSIRMRSTPPQSPARSLTTSRAVTAETATRGRELTTTRGSRSRSVLNGKTRSESRERSCSGAMALVQYSTRQRSPSRITRLYSRPKSHAKRQRLNRRRSISGSNSSTRRRSYSGSNSHKRRRRRSISGSNSSTRKRSYSGSNSHERRRRSISGSNSSTRRRSYSGSNSHERRRRRSISGSNSSTRRSYSGSNSHERRRRRSISGSYSSTRRRSYSGSNSHKRRRRRSISGSNSSTRQRSYSGSNSHKRRRRRSISGSNSSTRRSYSGSNSHERRRRRSISGSNSSTRRRSYSGSNSHERRRRRSISGSNSSTRRRSYPGSNSHKRRRRRSISGSNSSTRRRSYSGSNSHERRRRKRSISGSNSFTRQRSYSGSNSHERRRRKRSISGSSQASVQDTSSQSSEPVDLELFPFVKDDDIKYFGRLLRSINLSSPGISQTEVEKRHLIGIVLKIKNGPPATAQEATTELQKMAKTGRCCELFNLLLPMIFHTLWQDEREETMQKLIESVDAVIYKAGGKARPYIDKLLLVFQAGLCGTRQMKLIACRMVSKLTKVFGTRELLSNLTPDLDSPSAVVPNTNSYTVAIIAETAGLGAVLPYVKALCDSEQPAIKEAGFSTIQTIVHLLKKGVQPHIKPLMEHLQPDLQHAKFSLRRHWAEAVASVASMATKEDYPAFSAIWEHLLDRYHNNSQVLTVFEQSATFNIIFLKPSLTKEEHDIICDVFTKSCESPDERMRTNSAKMLCKLSLSMLVADDVFDEKFLRPFLQQSLLPSTTMTSHDQFCKICVRSARRLSAGKVCTYIVDGLFKQDGFLPVTDALAAILQKHGLSQITYHTERRIILGLMCAVRVQTFQSDDAIVTSIEKIMKLLRRRLCFHKQDIQQMLASATATSSPAAQRSPLNQLLMNLQGLCSQDQMTSELVLDGCVRSMTECL